MNSRCSAIQNGKSKKFEGRGISVPSCFKPILSKIDPLRGSRGQGLNALYQATTLQLAENSCFVSRRELSPRKTPVSYQGANSLRE